MQMCCMPTQISIKKEETKKIKHLLEWVMDVCVCVCRCVACRCRVWMQMREVDMLACKCAACGCESV